MSSRSRPSRFSFCQLHYDGSRCGSEFHPLRVHLASGMCRFMVLIKFGKVWLFSKHLLLSVPSSPSGVCGMLHGVSQLSVHFSSFFFLFLKLDNLNWSMSSFLILSSVRSNLLVEPLWWNFHLSYIFHLQNFYLVHLYFCHFLDILYLDVVSLAIWTYFFRADSLLSSSVYCGGTASTLRQARQSTLAFPSRLRGASRSSEVSSGASWPHTQPWACMWPSSFLGISQSFSKLLWTAPSPALPFKLCG